MFCARCKEELPCDGDFVTCLAGCKKCYHFECSAISEPTYKRMTDTKRKNWKCTECRKDGGIVSKVTCPGSVQERSRTRSTVEDVTGELKDGQQEGKPDVSDTQTLLVNMNNKLTNINLEIIELKKSVDFMSEKYDKLLLEVKDLRQFKEKHSNIGVEIKTLENRINDMEQYSRIKNVEIKGVEEIRNENLKEIIVEISDKIGVKLENKDIDAIHRVNNKKDREPRDIIVQFKDRESKEKILANRRVKVKSKEVTNGTSDNMIYINEHLTQQNKLIFWEARQKCREYNYRYVWTKNGKIFVRKNESERALRINSIDDMNKIV